MYYALVCEAKPVPMTQEEIESLGSPPEDGAQPMSLDFRWFLEGPIKKFKAAMRQVPPMLDNLVPHEMNRGFVLNRHPKTLPMGKIFQSDVPRALSEAIRQQFTVPPETVATLRAVEDAAMKGEPIPARPPTFSYLSFHNAIERGKQRAMEASIQPEVKESVRSLIESFKAEFDPEVVYFNVHAISRDEARVWASEAGIKGRGSMSAEALRKALADHIAQHGEIVHVGDSGKACLR